MGNCLTCFKEPASTTALDNGPQLAHKEEMPEVHLYPAPSQIPPSSAPPEHLLLSNGNHLMTTLPDPSGTLTRFYPGARRPTTPHHPKSAPTTTTMGLIESKSSETKINALFDSYKDDQIDDVILAEGIERLCRDLQISPDNFQILVLAWKLNAEQMCRFTRTEFVGGLKLLRADSIRTIQQRLPELVVEIDASEQLFKELYKFTFRFGLDGGAGQRNLSRDMAIDLWRLVFTVREPPILHRWLNYLECHQAIRGITSDTWNMFLFFSETVGDDLSSYNDNDAWPSLFDDFVEYENDQANQNVTKNDKDFGGGCGGDELIITQDE